MIWARTVSLGGALSNQDSGVSGTERFFFKQSHWDGRGWAWQQVQEPVNTPRTPFRAI